MTIEKLIDTGIINDMTEIYVRDEDFGLITHGNWYQDNILDHVQDKIECFSWQDDNRVYIDLE